MFIEHLADDDAVLVIDETGFLKQGTRRAVWRGKYTGRQARLRTARSASSRPTFPVHGHRSYDRALYLPKEWTAIQIVCKPHTCLPARALRPNQSLRRE